MIRYNMLWWTCTWNCQITTRRYIMFETLCPAWIACLKLWTLGSTNTTLTLAWSLDTHPAAMALDCHRTLARDSWAGFSHKTGTHLRAPWSNSETSQIPPFTPGFLIGQAPFSKSILIWPTFGQHPIISLSYPIPADSAVQGAAHNRKTLHPRRPALPAPQYLQLRPVQQPVWACPNVTCLLRIYLQG